MPLFKRIVASGTPALGNAQPAPVPMEPTPDVPHEVVAQDAMQNQGDTLPGDPREWRKGIERAAQALSDAAKTLSTFATNRVYLFDAASYSGLNLVHNLTLKGPAVRSIFVSYGLAGQTANTARVNIFRGSTGNGVPLVSCSWMTYQTMNVGDGTFELSVLLPTVATSALVRIVITDDIWAPGFGNVV